MHVRDAVLCGVWICTRHSCYFTVPFTASTRRPLPISTPAKHTPHIPEPTHCATLANRPQSLHSGSGLSSTGGLLDTSSWRTQFRTQYATGKLDTALLQGAAHSKALGNNSCSARQIHPLVRPRYPTRTGEARNLWSMGCWQHNGGSQGRADPARSSLLLLLLTGLQGAGS